MRNPTQAKSSPIVYTVITLSQAIRKILKKSVALIHSGVRKAKVSEIVEVFQRGKNGGTITQEIPQFIVGSTKLINVGLTLTAASHVIIFDSEWLSRDEQQAIARVNRISQTRSTETIKFVNKLSPLDMAIHDRQGARQEMYRTIEAPTLVSTNEEMRDAFEEDGLTDDKPEDDKPEDDKPDGVEGNHDDHV